jgi:hypothetical protein
MKKMWLPLVVVALCVAFAVPSVIAAEKKAEPVKKKEAAPKAAEVTQAELAHLLIQVLGLARFLPASPSDQQCFATLMNNGISPAGGWSPDKPVVKADLARVIVQSMKKQGDIKNPDDPKQWIDYLKEQGVPLDAVGETASYVDPLSEPVVVHVASAQVDPLVKRHKYNPVDETQYGVDMAYLVRVLSQFEFISNEFKPKPVTQD